MLVPVVVLLLANQPTSVASLSRYFRLRVKLPNVPALALDHDQTGSLSLLHLGSRPDLCLDVELLAITRLHFFNRPYCDVLVTQRAGLPFIGLEQCSF